MADTNKDPFSSGDSLSITMGGEVESETTDALSTDDIRMDAVTSELDTSEGASDADEPNNDEGTDDPLADADEGDEVGDTEDNQEDELGEFDPENAEAWDAKYLNEEGNYNEEALTAEFDGNEGKGLNEATYAYLATRGISKEFAKQIEAALVTKRDADAGEVAKQKGQDDLQLMTIAGGPEPLKAALDWGKSEGYSEEAQKRFNAVMEGDDFVAKQEAVELLISRHSKAISSAKPTTPKRDATKGGGKPSKRSLQPFKSREEYHAALDAAGDNQTQIMGITRRWMASPARAAG